MIVLFFSCKEENKDELQDSETKPIKEVPNEIVVISVNAPSKYVHLLKQDSIGKKLKDSIGPKSILIDNGFTYLDYMNNEQKWVPKPNVNDTIVIENYNEYLELSTNNYFTSIEETFLVKKGDTVIFNYDHDIPSAKIMNRKVNDVELNYNRYRLKKLFQNKYTSHFLIFGNLFLTDDIKDYPINSINYYNAAKRDYSREMQLLDSLNKSNAISNVNYQYRKDALNVLMEKNKKPKNIQKWLKEKQISNGEQQIEQNFNFDLSQTDSLMKFSFFREYLNNVSEYKLTSISENNGGSGANYIDSRIRFDSILKDRRFNQNAKNYLLFEAYKGIGQNFKVKDKKVYFEKLQENTTNREQLNKLENKYKLDFSKSDILSLTNLANESFTYSNVIKNNTGKWLYIDFWASWCKPCQETMPESKKLKRELKNKNIEFIYITLNDKKENWKNAIKSHSISESQNYFVENGNVSKVIEELGIRTIPHYLIYNPNGELISNYANRPGRGAKEELEKLINLK